MRKAASENKELHQKQKNQTLAFRSRDAALGINRIEVRCKDHNTEKDLPWDFDEDVGDQEGSPAVCL